MSRPGIRWAVFGTTALVQCAVLYAPVTGTPGAGVPLLDKVVHVTVFLAVAWSGRRAGMPLVLLVGLLLVQAVASEAAQEALLAHRSGDPLDLLADVLGIAVGVRLARAGTMSTAAVGSAQGGRHSAATRPAPAPRRRPTHRVDTDPPERG